MILDSLTFLAGGVSATGAVFGQSANGAGSILSTNTMDLSGQPSNFNEKLSFEIRVLAAPTIGTSVQFQLIQADDAALTSNVQVINQTDAFPIASLPAGTSIPMQYVRPAAYLPKQYLGMRFVNVGAIASASYVAGLTPDVATLKNMHFKSGISVA